MRALWLTRLNLREHPGGDTVQILKTADALRQIGVTVEMTSDPNPTFEGFDIIHMFHLDRLWEHVHVCRQIHAANCPSVLSTIYWPSDEFDQHARTGFQGTLARTLGSNTYRSLRLIQRGLHDTINRKHARSLTPMLLSFNKSARFLLNTVDLILPNSQAEADVIKKQFGYCPEAVVVPNAVDIKIFQANGSTSQRANIITVGRIEPRKNQLALIHAMEGLDATLTIIGKPGRFSRPYYEKCRRVAGDNIIFGDHMDQAALNTQYRRAKVHACVSWYETPGLASLEAALAGCNVVVTPGGCTREYFGDFAHYCEPNNVDSIRSALKNALQAEPTPELADKINTDYTWEMAAKRTLEGYERAIQKR